jgi:hypothetical protein
MRDATKVLIINSLGYLAFVLKRMVVFKDYGLIFQSEILIVFEDFINNKKYAKECIRYGNEKRLLHNRKLQFSKNNKLFTQ